MTRKHRVRLRLLLLLVLAWSAAPARAEGEPRREDRGDLVVLHLAGSYEEMGRQMAELMRGELRDVYRLQHESYERLLAQAGFGAGLLDRLLFPAWSAFGPLYEKSGFHDEIRGMAAGLDLPPRELLRAMFSLSAGSTVFVATRSATLDGAALIGRNVDWDDASGRRRPVVIHYHPDNGDLDHVSVGWPLVGLPTVGLNEAGFALSFNFFLSEPRVGLALPQWPHRRALQQAHNVEEAIQIFEETRLLGISTFMAMADAQGDIALLECVPSRCTVFRPEGDWFAQANHARTHEMIPYDTYRSPDSFSRREAMEAAVRPHLGRLEPELASRILRDRSNARYPNDSTVGNPSVLNAVVVHPASRTLWHSTSMQPFAPFGTYVPFTPGPEPSDAPELPADASLGSPAQQREAAAIEKARRGLAYFDREEYGAALELWTELAKASPPQLDPARLAWARALALWHEGQLEGAYTLLGETERGPFDIQVNGLVARARISDALGARARALRLYHQARDLLDARSEFNVFDGLRAQIALGLEAPQPADPAPELGFLLGVPR